jgi:hypothetical protein
VGQLAREYLEPDSLTTISISSDDHLDSAERSAGVYDSDLDPDVDIRMENDVDTPDGVDLDSDVDIERDGDDA